jgi:hypothetical protein
MSSNILSNLHLAGLASLHRGGGSLQVAEIHYIYKKVFQIRARENAFVCLVAVKVVKFTHAIVWILERQN